MRETPVLPDGSLIRWTDIPGGTPTRVYLHGLGGAAAPYYAAAAAHPRLTGRRSILIDMLGFGLSDRPAEFDYTLESHADTLATALRSAGVSGVDLVAHSMGGSVGILLAARHPGLVARLVLVDANLEALRPDRGVAGSAGVATYTEDEWVRTGWPAAQARFGAQWWATMRWADPVPVYRSSVGLVRGSDPVMREVLCGLEIPRTFLVPGNDGPPPRPEDLTAAGVNLVTVADSGHCIMLDNPDGFAVAVAEATP